MSEKKELTIKQQKNKYRKYQILANIGEYTVLPIPFCALMIVNRNEWFTQNPEGWKIGIGGTLALLLMAFATFLVTKQQEKDSKLTDGYVSLMLGWLMGCIIFTLISDIANQIANIMWVGFSGIGAAFGLDITRKVMKQKADKYKTTIESAQLELDKQQAMEEIKTVKVRIKK